MTKEKKPPVKKQQPKASAINRFQLLPSDMPWQTGDYARLQQFDFILPSQFLMLCKILDIRPQIVLLDFIINLDGGSSYKWDREQAKERLVEYFLLMGYGQMLYSREELRELFKEMDAMGLLFPEDADKELADIHEEYQKKYHYHWFNKWYRKLRRAVIIFLLH